MPRRRKTGAERERETRELDRRAWEEFRPKLEALQSYTDALAFVHQSPPPDSPGRHFYSNLAFFLQSFAPPMGASGGEKSLYLKLVQRFDEAGQLEPGRRAQIEADLRAAIERDPW
jgi:hypothetical protein